MKTNPDPDAALGVAMALFGLGVALLWVPLDSETGLAEKVRGRWTIGDALAPSAAAALIVLGGLGLALGHRRRGTLPAPDRAALSAANLGFLAGLLAVLAAMLLVMRWAGPAATALAGLGDYRPLRDEAPWKHVGFVLGGGGMIAVLTGFVERRLPPARLLLALGIALGIALLYDLPFEDLLLPPNGDL